MEYLNQNAGGIGIIFAILATLLIALGWFITSTITSTITAFFHKELKPINEKLGKFNEKLDKFTGYERDNLKAHLEMSGTLGDHETRLNKLEGQSQSFSIQMGMVQHQSDTPPDAIPPSE